LVSEKKKLQNWLDYYQLKFERNASKRLTTKVPHK
jgi:calcium permeable stress-gated cation channel